MVPPTSQVGFCLRLHRCQEANNKGESPAGWPRLLLGLLKTELCSLKRARGCGERVTGPAFNQGPFSSILQQRLGGSGKPKIHFKPSNIPLSKKTPSMFLLDVAFFPLVFLLLSLRRCSSRKTIDCELQRYKYSKPDGLTPMT